MASVLKCYFSVLVFPLIWNHFQVTAETPPESNAFTVPEGWKSPATIAQDFSYYISGHDYEGRPVVIAEVGKWDFRKMVEAGGTDLENFRRHMAQFINLITGLGTRNETFLKNFLPSDEENAPSGTVVIGDMEGFNFFQVTSPRTLVFLVQLFRFVAEIKVEEALAYVHLINTNAAGEFLVNIARPIVGTLLEKIDIHGTNRERWIPVLRKLIPENQLPTWYGGSADFKPISVHG